MVGEEHLETAAKEVQKYMQETSCGFCQRKAEAINRAIIGLKDVTAEAQQLAAKIQARKELAGIEKETLVPMVKPLVEPRPKAIFSQQARERIRALKPEPLLESPAPKVTYYPPTHKEPARAIVEPKAKLKPIMEEKGVLGFGLTDLVRSRPRLKDIIYTGD